MPIGSGVDEFDLLHALSFDVSHMLRQFFFSGHRFQSRNQTFQNQRSFSGTGHPGDHRQLSFWNGHLQRLYRVNGIGGKTDISRIKYSCADLILCGADNNFFIFSPSFAVVSLESDSFIVCFSPACVFLALFM